MGYVLPVQMDTYTQYANRTVSDKQQLRTEPVFKAAFYKVDPQLSWQEIHRNARHHHLNMKKVKQASRISDKLLSDLTGKGLYVFMLLRDKVASLQTAGQAQLHQADKNNNKNTAFYFQKVSRLTGSFAKDA